ncbi:MAG: thiamine ABC transporter substrate binding subunit [Rhodospirillaceae bacterium]|nr:thiamine ABC transporter substrate binding subunit [Rhodospirillaceae bacterium]
MKPILTASTALALGLAAAPVLSPALAQTPELVVYTYSSFVSDWGPGPELEEMFEAQCGCDLEFVGVEDGVVILSRLRLEGDSTDADVALGLDTNLLAEARDTGLLAPHDLDLSDLDLPVAWDDDVFVPYDYGYFAFVYDTEVLAEPPASLDELVHGSDAEVLVEDPRTSTPGLGLLLWMRSLYGDEADAAWAALRPRIVTVSAGWSEAYGLFLGGEAPLVLSYTTSPAYHRIAEETERYAAALFEDGHYLQVEVAARLAGSDQPELARQFLEFLVSPDAQAVIPTTNWMYPVRMPEDGLPDAFDDPSAITPLLIDPEEVAANRRQWIDDWLEAMSR